MTGPAASPDPRRLALIRISLAGGVFMFGSAIWFMHGRPGFIAASGASNEFMTLEMLFIYALAGSVIGMFFVRRLWSRAAEPAKRASFAIIGWACGEAPALAGAVNYWFTDDPRLYIAGVFVFLTSFILFPLRGPE